MDCLAERDLTIVHITLRLATISAAIIVVACRLPRLVRGEPAGRGLRLGRSDERLRATTDSSIQCAAISRAKVRWPFTANELAYSPN